MQGQGLNTDHEGDTDGEGDVDEPAPHGAAAPADPSNSLPFGNIYLGAPQRRTTTVTALDHLGNTDPHFKRFLNKLTTFLEAELANVTREILPGTLQHAKV